VLNDHIHITVSAFLVAKLSIPAPDDLVDLTLLMGLVRCGGC
jgi:hypothetical protein